MKPKSMMPQAKQRRYYLHKELKKHLKIDVKNRIIYTKSTSDLDEKVKNQLKELLGFGYMCQLVF